MRGASDQPFEKDLVLVGGGHTHVQVLRRWMMDPVPGVRLTVVVDRHEAVYSGMVPGAVAGDYATPELEIDVLPLARRAGARCIHAAATRVDPTARSLELEGRPPIPYDVASLDIGSTVRGLDIPGVRAHALATRPIGRFVYEIDAAVAAAEAAAGEQPLRLAIVGGGAAGVELAFCLEARLRTRGSASALTLVTGASDVLLGASAALRRRARAEAARRGIELRVHTYAQSVDATGVQLRPADDAGADLEHLDADLVLWATGASPQPLLAQSPLALDAAGFARARSTLQVEGHDDLFAVGDCAALVDHPWLPRAGVYAVREGPILDHNLRARLRGRPLRVYRPQRDFLALINLGEGRALGGKWGFAFQGAWVWRVKDWIDRRFMHRFQVLDADGAPAAPFPAPAAMAVDERGDPIEMECGGCAAKVGPVALRDALSRLPAAPDDPSVRLGVDEADDVAAFETAKGDLLLATVDGFRAFVDDPWLVGRVAAVNAISDVQAKGGRARHALALVTVPDEGPRRSADLLYQVLAGVRAALDPLGVSLVGGHSTLGSELFVGLSVTGDLPGDAGWLRLDALAPGDDLILTKPLGAGVLLAADMRGLAPARWIRPLVAELVRDNGAAAALATNARAHAATDISGFGLAAHLLEMLRASDVAAELDLGTLPVYRGALALIERGVRSTYHGQNAAVGREIAFEPTSAADADPRAALLFDPQTSGGLLLGIDPTGTAALVAQLREAGYVHACRIGRTRTPDARPRLTAGARSVV